MKKHILFIAFLIISSHVFAQLKTSKLFSDHMVLQQNHDIKVWGTHKKGKTITVTFNNITRKIKTNKKGEWMVSFPAMQGGNKLYKMKIISGTETILLSDIVIGDVWICSGQSNMEWPLTETNNAVKEIANANDSNIRHFKVPTSYANTPEKTLAGGTWQVTSSETVGSFTAVGYYFAKNIRKHHNIPIGLLNTSWGGSRIEPWMNAKTLNIDNASEYLQSIENEMMKSVEKSANKLREKFPYLKEEGVDYSSDSWADKNLDTSDWKIINVPNLWELEGYESFDGMAWYRTTFELSKKEAENGISLGLAMIDDSDYVWVNGNKIGETIQLYNAKRVYTIDSKHLVEGKNTIAVKVDDTGGGGGIYGDKTDLYVRTINQSISLAKPWQFKICSYRKSSMSVNQVPMMLYNKMIYPLLNFPIKGAIWYQGESNANNKEESQEYATLFPKMIQQWRNDWKIGDFPFLWVQLANFMAPQEPSVESNWAYLRASQSSTLNILKTAEAVIIDIGEANDIHPRNKKDVGYRLSLGARKLAYNEDIVFSGPTYKSQKIIDNTIEVCFNHIGKGLISKDKYGYVKGFTIAGTDKKFVWAKATIKNNKVIIWSDTIKKPLYVRYAWADNPEDANLYNEDGLPASPFKTDTLN